MKRITIEEPVKKYPFMVTINPSNYVGDCSECNCARWCQRHKYGVSRTPNLKLIEEIKNGY
jgi:hypothetical protein